MKIHLNKTILHTARSALNQYCKIYLRLRSQPHKIILILAHARSGSSLLQHLLMSNKQIAGFGENHISYEKLEDLDKLAQNVLWRRRKFILPEIYLIDKIVHFRTFSISDEVIQSKRVFTIFLIRHPEDSIISLADNRQDELANSCQYYTEMIDKIEYYSGLIPHKDHGFFLTYEQLINNTSLVLSKLTQFFQLTFPLEEKYNILPTTGKGLYGDWSENIKSGEILRVSKKKSPRIPTELISNAMEAYHHGFAVLSQFCTTIDSPSV